MRTHELLCAFGWDDDQRCVQEDVNEFSGKLLETLESEAAVKETCANLFYGIQENVIKCINVKYESRREEKFHSIQLVVTNNLNIENSLREYLAAEKMDGDNQYETEKYGKQDARKFIRLT